MRDRRPLLLWAPVATVLILICPTWVLCSDGDLERQEDDGPKSTLSASACPGAPELTGALLVDYSHGANFDVDVFRNHLASLGWTVEGNGHEPLSAELLDPFDILLISTCSGGVPLLPYTPEEIATVQAFVASGGGLWAFYEPPCSLASINGLVAPYGVTFTLAQVSDSTDNAGRYYYPTIHTLEPHPIFDGVESYTLYSGARLESEEPSMILATGDDDTYDNEGTGTPYPPVLVGYEAGGRAIFSGDITPLHDIRFCTLPPAERQLLYNILDWLLGAEATPVQNVSWGKVKSWYITK